MTFDVIPIVGNEKCNGQKERKDSNDEKGDFICRYFFQINFEYVKIITEFLLSHCIQEFYQELIGHNFKV